MPKSRLQLDFKIEKSEDRKIFVDKYIDTLENPTEEELEMIGNYILWGKSDQSHNFEIETRNKTWSRAQKVESLDALIEQPNFDENIFYSSTPLKLQTQKFQRNQEIPNYFQPIFNNLFNKIDEIELSINFYELAHSKRINPPRAELIKKFSASKIIEIKTKAESWTQRYYLKMRHLIVELRREQFTLRDSFKPSLLTHLELHPPNLFNYPIEFDTDIFIAPLGVRANPQSEGIWISFQNLIPQNFSEEQLKRISKFFWGLQNNSRKTPLVFDFRDEELIYALSLNYYKFKELALEDKFLHQNILTLMDTFDFYKQEANLSEMQLEILEMKMRGQRNADIAFLINKKFNKSYNNNYISTIFKKKILKQIAATASYHYKIIENLRQPEAFKTCSSCGDTLLRDPINFMRKARSSDGFNSRCKKCDKAARQKKR